MEEFRDCPGEEGADPLVVVASYNRLGFFFFFFTYIESNIWGIFFVFFLSLLSASYTLSECILGDFLFAVGCTAVCSLGTERSGEQEGRIQRQG